MNPFSMLLIPGIDFSSINAMYDIAIFFNFQNLSNVALEILTCINWAGRLWIFCDLIYILFVRLCSQVASIACLQE